MDAEAQRTRSRRSAGGPQRTAGDMAGTPPTHGKARWTHSGIISEPPFSRIRRSRRRSGAAVHEGDPLAVGRAVRDGKADLGIVLGGSGQGEQLAANKVRGVRAALCNCLYTAKMARSHNNANVLSMGARVVGVGLAEEIVTTFLATDFEGGRHERRVAQLAEIEEQESK